VRYVIVTPVRNEARYIRFTLDSVVSQTIKPLEWIIVDDGSEDNTAEIAQEYAKSYPWIKVMAADLQGQRQRGGRVVRVFCAGFDAIAADYDFIVKLDGDLSFDDDYFEDLMRRFEDPKLGIAGGEIHFLEGDSWRVEKTPLDHVRGATKVYRESCFQDIGGLAPVNGWDAVDELRAQMKGWKTRTFRDLCVRHHRPTGAVEGRLKGRVRQGETSYFLGYTWSQILARSTYRGLMDRPFILGGTAMLWGYVRSWLTRKPQFGDQELRAYLRQKKSVRTRLFGSRFS
jgi:biofilm PGA synthesis N-glycosyltransferase PgaC